MASNSEALKSAYDAFAQGDADKAIEAFADDAVWQGFDSTELPGGGEHKGKDAILELVRGVAEPWDEYQLVPDELYEDGDSVVVLLHADVKKDDRSGQLATVHIVRFEDGKIKRVQGLTDTLLAAQLLGLIGGKPPEEHGSAPNGPAGDDEAASDDEREDEDQ